MVAYRRCLKQIADAETQSCRVAVVFSHADSALRKKLEEHLSLLKRDNLIAEWFDGKIGPGEDLDQSIDENLARSDIVFSQPVWVLTASLEHLRFAGVQQDQAAVGVLQARDRGHQGGQQQQPVPQLPITADFRPAQQSRDYAQYLQHSAGLAQI